MRGGGADDRRIGACGRRADAHGNQFRGDPDRGLDQPEEELGAVPAGDVQSHRLQGERSLRHRLCRRHRRDEVQQGKECMVWRRHGAGGGKPAREAVDRAGGEVFARIVARDGNDGYYSHIIVHKDSPFAKVEDILKCDKSLDFGIGDPNSTSGFLVPTAYIFAARNIDPKTCFKTVRNANHQANAMAVANKQVAVATNNSENLQRVEVTAPDARSQIKIIWTSPLIPLDPLVWRKDLDPAVKTKLYTFLMSYGRIGSDDEIATAKAILADLVWSTFQPSSDNQLIPIRVLEANKTLMRIQGDEKLSAEEKSSQIAAIRADIAKLEEMQKKADSDEFHSR